MAEETPEKDTPSVKSSTWQVTGIGVLAVVALGLFAYLFTALSRSPTIDVDDKLRLAFEQYSEKKWSNAEAIASSLTEDPDWTSEQRKKLGFLLAASNAHQVILEPDNLKRREKIRDTVEKLDLAIQVGLPESYEAEGNQLAGEADFIAGKFSNAAKKLAVAGDRDPVIRRAVLFKLAQALYRADDGSTDASLATIDEYLTLSTIGNEKRTQARLLRAEILASQNRWKESFDAVSTVSRIQPENVEAKLIAAKIKLAKAKSDLKAATSANGPLRKASLALVAEVAAHCIEIARTTNTIPGYDAMLVAGQAQRLLENYEVALGLFGLVRQNRIDKAVAIAAGIEELEVLSEHGTAAECLGTTVYLIREIGETHLFEPRVVSLKEFQKRITKVVQNLEERNEFDAAIELAQSLVPVFSIADALRLEAGTHSAKAGLAHKNIISQTGPSLDLVKAKREYHKLAANAYAKAAELEFVSPEYPSFLWDAIEQYEQANMFDKCIGLLEPYLTYEDRQLIPRGLILKGKSQMALREYEDALRTLETCIEEFTRDSMIYEARLIASKAAAELGLIEKARNLLELNLHDGFLAPSSRVWQESLYALGEILYEEATSRHFVLTTPVPNQTISEEEKLRQYQANQILLESSILRLEEAVTRYAGTPRSRRARYLLAQAHRYASHWPATEAKMDTVLESRRRQLNLAFIEHLQSSADAFRLLRDELNKFQDDNSLSETEQLMLRNCYLGEADSLFALGRYEDAIAAYSATTNRFIEEPLSLEAMVQQARCFELLGRDSDVERVLKQAKQILTRIPPELDSVFAQTTRYDRDGWSEFLDWLVPS